MLVVSQCECIFRVNISFSVSKILRLSMVRVSRVFPQQENEKFIRKYLIISFVVLPFCCFSLSLFLSVSLLVCRGFLELARVAHKLHVTCVVTFRLHAQSQTWTRCRHCCHKRRQQQVRGRRTVAEGGGKQRAGCPAFVDFECRNFTLFSLNLHNLQSQQCTGPCRTLLDSA